MYDEFFSKAHELTQRGEPFATATVVRAEKPTSGKPGDKAIITRDGVLHGWIGGSCAQPTVIAEALEAIRRDESRLVRITPDARSERPREGLKEVSMTCFSGGTLDVYIEPQQPQPRLLVVGDRPIAHALAELGRAMSYRVIACDPDGALERFEEADETVNDLDELVDRVSPMSFVVVATHSHWDEMALKKLLGTGAPYFGLVASRKRAESVIGFLRGSGVGEASLARLKVPAGLDIGARRGDEIALSIMAEIVQHRRRAEGVKWRGSSGESAATPTEEPETAAG